MYTCKVDNNKHKAKVPRMKSFFLICLQAIPLTQAGEEIRVAVGGREGIKAGLKPGYPQLRADPGLAMQSSSLVVLCCLVATGLATKLKLQTRQEDFL
jgi:hypothetical protein